MIHQLLRKVAEWITQLHSQMQDGLMQLTIAVVEDLSVLMELEWELQHLISQETSQF